MVKGHVTLPVEAPQCKSRSCQVWWLQAMGQWRYNGFGLSHDLNRPHNQGVEQLYE